MNTTDLFFASYLKLKGYKLTNYKVVSRGKGRYFFEITDEEYKKEKLEYSNSDISKIKQISESLKDLLY